MAGKVVKDLSEDFLNCCICMNPFKTPKMLPCIHSFCEECIEKYTSKQNGDEVPCPTCRKVCTLPETGVKGLQTNFHLINLAERVQLLEKLTSKEKKTSVCDSCKSPEVVAFCVDCNFAICSKCQGHHALFPLLQSHSVISLNEIVGPKFQQEWKNARSPFCALHPSEKLRFYCKTCSKLICRDCTIVIHSKPQHECTEASSQFNESKGELSSLLDNSMDELEKAVGFINEGNVGFAALNRSKKEIEIEITKHYNKMIEEIRKVYDQQKQDLLNEISTGIEPVESRLQVAGDWVKRMQTTQDMTRKIITENNPWELMAMSFDLTTAFEALKSDSSAFQWSKSQLQHEMVFSPGPLPDIKIGFHYRQCDVVASDKQDMFFLCTFDECSKYLNITKFTKSNGKVENVNPYQWQHDIPDGARLITSAGLDQIMVLCVALGNQVVEFDCTSMHLRKNFTARMEHNTVAKFMNMNTSDRRLYITSTSPEKEKNINSQAMCNVFSKAQHQHSFTFSTDASIDSVFVCPNDAFFYTGNDELKSYNHLAKQNGCTVPDVCYDVDSPKTLLTVTETDILHCHTIGTYPAAKDYNYYNNYNCYHDNVHVFILWKGNVIKAGKNTDEKAWILKEYITKDKKVLGELNYVNDNAPKPPSALQCQQTGNGGMEIHLCDDLGNITKYIREPYNKDVVPYNIV